MNSTNSKLSVYQKYPELYDILYGGGQEDYLSFLDWLFTYLGVSKNAKILDMGSGTGRLLIPLTIEGYDVIGMEPYAGMREITLKKAQETDIQIQLKEGSFQTLETQGMYSLIYSIDGTMAYLNGTSEYADAFANISKALKPNGFFVLDLMNFYALIKAYKYPEVESHEIRGKKITSMVHHEIDPVNEIWIHKSTVFIENTGKWDKIEDIHHLTMISRKLLIKLGNEAGLKVEFILNNIQDRPDEKKNGFRNIIIFRKE